MTADLLKYWNHIRASYWFIPTVMALGAVLLAWAAVAADVDLGNPWVGEWAWVRFDEPAAARTLLSTLAGSMITVAGVTFSITIASVAYASGQFGPRLLGNFMRDRGNQITLGTFISTFVYCLIVLRSVSAGKGPDTEFVPHLALLVAMVLTAASLAVFIYFIHHVPESIHISNVVADIGRQLHRAVERRYPLRRPEPAREPEPLPDGFSARAVSIRASRSGYVQNLVAGALLEVATEHDLVIDVLGHPGNFVHENQAIVRVWPPDRIDERVGKRIRAAYALGAQRTQSQDEMFLVEELVEMAARALSSGINDPFTANTCLDWLRAALSRVARGCVAEAVQRDEQGNARVFLRSEGFADFAGAAFDQMRGYFVSDGNASLHMMRAIDLLAREVREEEHRRVLRNHARAVLDGCRKKLEHERDRTRVERVYHQAMSRLSIPSRQC